MSTDSVLDTDITTAAVIITTKTTIICPTTTKTTTEAMGNNAGNLRALLSKIMNSVIL